MKSIAIGQINVRKNHKTVCYIKIYKSTPCSSFSMRGISLMNKKCNKCRNEFPLTHFHKVKNKSDGRRNTCPDCRKIYEKQTSSSNLDNHKGEWDENEVLVLTQLRLNGLSYPIIANILKRSVQSIQQKSFKLGLTTQNKSEENLDIFEDYELFSSLDSKVKGTISEHKVFIKFVEHNIDVFTPFTAGTEEDCIIRKNNRYFRIQIKTATLTNEHRFRASIVRKRNKGMLKGQRVRYENIDFYLIYVPVIETFYVIPETATTNVKEVNLYPHRSKTIIKGVNWESYREAFGLIE